MGDFFTFSTPTRNPDAEDAVAPQPTGSSVLSYFLNQPVGLRLGTGAPFGNVMTDFLVGTPSGDVQAGATAPSGPNANIGTPQKRSSVDWQMELQNSLDAIDEQFSSDAIPAVRRTQLALNPAEFRLREQAKAEMKARTIDAVTRLMQEDRLRNAPSAFQEELDRKTADIIASQRVQADRIAKVNAFIQANPDLPQSARLYLQAYATLGAELPASALGTDKDALNKAESAARIGSMGVTDLSQFGLSDLNPIARQAYAATLKAKPPKEEPLNAADVLSKVANMARDFQALSSKPTAETKTVVDEYGQEKTTTEPVMRPTIDEKEALRMAAESILKQDPRAKPLLENFLQPQGPKNQAGFDAVGAAKKELERRRKANAGSAKKPD